MKINYNPKYPLVEDLRNRARRRIPQFAFDYVDGGCNEEVNLQRNTAEIQEIELVPRYISKITESNLKTKLFGHTYDAPFGIAPMGLQGMIWPDSSAILAKAAHAHNIPFVLSTVTTSSIEEVSEITDGRAWFQLYHPVEDTLRDKLLHRAEAAGCSVLVIISDVPTFGYRAKEIRSGLAMPPRMTLRNICQMVTKPNWALRSLYHGRPQFATLQPYIPKNLDLRNLGRFMNETFKGTLNETKIARLSDKWKRKLIIKGLTSEEDMEIAIKLGLDGVIVSNHGGRQLDAAESTIKSVQRIAPKYGDRIEVMMDSGIRSGPDVARTIACGARFAFLGRPFMYGVAALGKEGGNHTVSIIKTQLRQVMEQIRCGSTSELPLFLNKNQTKESSRSQ